jgi:signal transduction histidine kinase/CheY-like chemotaxis protein
MSEARKRIFIVEDQRLIAADLKNTLEKLGYVVVGGAASGEEALSEVDDAKPDLLLMDIRLGGEMDGIETASAIQKRRDVPVVYVTAYADEETIRRAKLTSPFGYVVKPYNERELRAAIEIALYKHETDRLLADERARRQAAEEFRTLVHFLDRATVSLTSTLSTSETVERAASVSIPHLADCCLVDLANDRGRLVQVAASHMDPEKVKLARKLGRTLVPELGLEHGAAATFRTGRSQIHPSIDDESWAAEILGIGHPELLRALGVSSYICVPIRFAGRVQGVINFLRTEARRYRAKDLDVAEEFSRRVGLALDNARLYQEMEAAVQMRDEFLQVASHELRTPLTPLKLQLHMLREMVPGAEASSAEVVRKFDVANRQLGRLERLVESLLEVGRFGGGGTALEVESFDLVELAHDVVERFAEEAATKGSTLRVNASQPVEGRWDRHRLDQVVSNLVSNALKYGAGHPVEVAVEDRGAEATLSVRDEGIGIEAEALDRIFGKFERASSVRNYGGLGLGLYISGVLAQAHGGRITASSRPGKGATFTLWLPRYAAASHRAKRRETNHDGDHHRPRGG